MTAVNPPYAMQSRTDHDAVGFRRMMMSFLSGANLAATSPRGGIVPTYGNRMNVTGSGSIMQVTVDTGMCFVPHATAWAGAYHCFNDAGVNLSIAAANATQYRRDLIIAQVLDTAYGDGSSLWQLAVVQGTNSASSPAPLPTQPTRSLLLAIVNVDPAITNLSGKVSDQRTYLSVGSGNLLATSTTRPATPHSGFQVYESDTGTVRFYDGSGYRFVADNSWKTWTPGVANAGTLTYNSRTGHYKMIGEKTAAFFMHLSISGAGSSTSPLGLDFPFDLNRAIRQQGVASLETSSVFQTGHWVTLVSGSDLSLVDVIRVTNTGSPGMFTLSSDDLSSGHTLLLSGIVELA